MLPKTKNKRACKNIGVQDVISCKCYKTIQTEQDLYLPMLIFSSHIARFEGGFLPGCSFLSLTHNEADSQWAQHVLNLYQQPSVFSFKYTCACTFLPQTSMHSTKKSERHSLINSTYNKPNMYYNSWSSIFCLQKGHTKLHDMKYSI